VWGKRGGLLWGSFVGRCLLCLGNVCGVREVGCSGVLWLDGVYCVLVWWVGYAGGVVMGFICWKVYIVCR
jgi:hypothetical protein